MNTNVLVLGEIVGKPGIHTIRAGLKALAQQRRIDFVIAGAEGVTNGFGLGSNHSLLIRKSGVDVLTLGDKAFFKKDMVDHIAKAPYILRPANLPAVTPGRGWRIYEKGGRSIAVINLLGQAEFNRVHASNPFSALPGILETVKKQTNCIILQFHAATTAEKNAMFFHADGEVSAVIGTHTKALTSDGRVFPKGTAVITDAGRCGSQMSVGGFDPEVEIRKFLTQVPERSLEWWMGLELQGALVEIGEDGRAVGIETIKFPVETPKEQRR